MRLLPVSRAGKQQERCTGKECPAHHCEIRQFAVPDVHAEHRIRYSMPLSGSDQVPDATAVNDTGVPSENVTGRNVVPASNDRSSTSVPTKADHHTETLKFPEMYTGLPLSDPLVTDPDKTRAAASVPLPPMPTGRLRHT
nr:hypothetical protein [uncultured Rhodopila sp.]